MKSLDQLARRSRSSARSRVTIIELGGFPYHDIGSAAEQVLRRAAKAKLQKTTDQAAVDLRMRIVSGQAHRRIDWMSAVECLGQGFSGQVPAAGIPTQQAALQATKEYFARILAEEP